MPHIFTHERFHCYQSEQKLVLKDYDYPKLQDINNAQLLYLEAAVLKKFLISSQIDHLKDFVAVNTIRTQLLDKESLAYERQKEIMEGTADYVAASALNITQSARRDWIIKNYQEKCSLRNSIKCVLHDHYYFTGTVMGLGLNILKSPDWQQRIFQQTLAPSIILQQALPLSKYELQKRLENIKRNYNFDKLAADIERAYLDYQIKTRAAVVRHKKQPGVITRLVFLHHGCYAQYRSKKQYYLTAKNYLHEQFSGEEVCGNNDLRLSYTDMPYILFSAKDQEFKLSQRAVIMHDDKTYTVGDLLKNHKGVSFPAISDYFSKLYFRC